MPGFESDEYIKYKEMNDFLYKLLYKRLRPSLVSGWYFDIPHLEHVSKGIRKRKKGYFTGNNDEKMYRQQVEELLHKNYGSEWLAK